MGSSNSAENLTLSPQYNEVEIPGIGLVVTASKTGEQSMDQKSGPPRQILNTIVSNVLEWLVDETINIAFTLSTVGLEKRYSKKGGDSFQM